MTTVTGRGNQLGPRVMAERRAGKFLVDVYIAGLTSTYEILYRAKILDPVRTALILPEVLDESKWWQAQHHYPGATPVAPQSVFLRIRRFFC